jgi:hypothetical protein
VFQAPVGSIVEKQAFARFAAADAPQRAVLIDRAPIPSIVDHFAKGKIFSRGL